jgi:RHS repeat-associated protein
LRLAYLNARNPKGSGNGIQDQKTYYMYTDATNASLQTAIIYPDTQDVVSVDGDNIVTFTTDNGDHVAVTYDRLGRRATVTDQRDVVHAYTYDSAGRLSSDDADTPADPLPAGVDSAVVKLGRAYDDLGRLQTVTSYDASDTVVNEVKVTYGAWGNVTKSEQDHAGAAGPGDPDIQYVYDDGASGGDAKYVRLDTVTYPNDRVVYYHYANTTTSANWTDQEKIGQKLSRLRTIAKADIGAGALADSNKYAQYTYLGAGTVVKVAHPAVTNGLDLTYGTGGAYPAFDRFGRILWQKWTSGSTWKDVYWYGYDRVGNRLWRGERQDKGVGGNRRDEVYEYDGLHRLKKAQRGTLLTGAPIGGDANMDGVIDTNDYDIINRNWLLGTGDEWGEGDFNGDGVIDSNDYDIINANWGSPPSASLSHTGQWTLDALGNWTEYKIDDDSTLDWDVLDQNRAHNKANEIDGNSGDPIWPQGGSGGWKDPIHDAAGNQTFGPKPGAETTADEAHHCVYDAWNRLVEVWEDTNEDGDLDAEGTDTQILECRYDGLGRRIAKTDKTGESDVTYDYYYNTSWQVLEVRKGGDTDPLDQYVWDIRYIDAPVLRWYDENTDGQDVQTLYYTNDANFNTTALVEEDGDVVERVMYDPYGKPTFYDADWANPSASSAYANEILYCGYRYDHESRLYHVRHRMYHPTLGRWTSRDPIGYWHAMHLYGYVMGAPTAFVDPFGLMKRVAVGALHIRKYMNYQVIHSSNEMASEGERRWARFRQYLGWAKIHLGPDLDRMEARKRALIDHETVGGLSGVFSHGEGGLFVPDGVQGYYPPKWGDDLNDPDNFKLAGQQKDLRTGWHNTATIFELATYAEYDMPGDRSLSDYARRRWHHYTTREGWSGADVAFPGGKPVFNQAELQEMIQWIIDCENGQSSGEPFTYEDEWTALTLGFTDMTLHIRIILYCCLDTVVVQEKTIELYD